MTSNLCHSFVVLFREFQEKYTSKGKFIALFTFVAYFALLPNLLEKLWPQVEHFPTVPLYFMTVTFINIFILVIYNLAMIPIYSHKWFFFERYRASCEPWPWEIDSEAWRVTLRKSLKIVSLNALFVGPSLTLVDSLLSFEFKMKTTQSPSVITHAWQFLVFLLVEQVVFYFIHRWMHDPNWYWIHKMHHQYNVTVTIAAEYAHPIQHLLANTFATGVGYKMLSKIFPVHIFTIIIWLMFRVLETCDGHSGYNWSWAQSSLFPFSAGGKYHFFHHKNNSGNFAAILTVMDDLGATNADFRKTEAKSVAQKLK